MGATCLSAWLFQLFPSFLKIGICKAGRGQIGGSRSIWEIEFEKCDPPYDERVALCFWVASFNTLIRCSGGDLAPNQADLEKVRPAFRWAGRTWGVGLRGSKKCRKMKVLRMKCSIVENTPTSQESILKLFLASQLPYRAKIQKMLEI